MKETNSWIDKKKATKYRILVLGTPDGCLFPRKRGIFDAFLGPSGFADPSGSQNGEPIPSGATTLLPFPGWDPRNWPFRPNQRRFGLLGRPKFGPPEGKSVLGTPNLANFGQIRGPWSRIWASQTLDRGSPTPNMGSQRPNFGQNWPIRPFWPPGDPHFDLWEVKMTPNLSSGRSKIDHFTQFSSFL